MEQRRLAARRSLSFVVQIVLLLGMLSGLSLMLVVVTKQAPRAEPQVQGALVRLAWICAALIGLTLVMIAWSVLRYAKYVSWSKKGLRPMPRFDAWAEAGQRFQLDPNERDERQ